MKNLIIAVLFMISVSGFSQVIKGEKLPFKEVPDNPETYTADAMAARMVDALGF